MAKCPLPRVDEGLRQLDLPSMRMPAVPLPQVYKKPANYKRSKKPQLLSVKNYYLHLHLTIETITEHAPSLP